MKIRSSIPKEITAVQIGEYLLTPIHATIQNIRKESGISQVCRSCPLLDGSFLISFANQPGITSQKFIKKYPNAIKPPSAATA